MSDGTRYVTLAEAEDLAERAAEKAAGKAAGKAAEQAIDRYMQRMGINTDNWEDVQKTWHWAENGYRSSERMREAFKAGAARGLGGTIAIAILTGLYWLITTFSMTKGGP